MRWRFPFVLDISRPIQAFNELPDSVLAKGQTWGQSFPRYNSVCPAKYAPKRLLLRLVQLLSAQTGEQYHSNICAAEPLSSPASNISIEDACTATWESLDSVFQLMPVRPSICLSMS